MEGTSELPQKSAWSAAKKFGLSAWKLTLDLVYPPRCGGCERPGAWLCADCRAGLAPASPPVWKCAVCLQPLQPQRDQLACPNDCAPDSLRAVLAAGVYGGSLREAIHHFKYNGWQALAPDLAAQVYGVLQGANATVAPWPQDTKPWLIPVPLHRRRKRYRGFNQSELLAHELSMLLDWEIAPGLERQIFTRPQVDLSAEDRASNMNGAFAWKGAPLTGPIVLVDDVFTTGSTMRACAAALHKVGCGPVYGLVLASPNAAKQSPEQGS